MATPAGDDRECPTTPARVLRSCGLIPRRQPASIRRRPSAADALRRLRSDPRPPRLAIALGALGLVGIVLGCLIAVAVAARGPGPLSPPSHSHYFPAWLAGPLGDTWPFPSTGSTLLHVFDYAVAWMYPFYGLAILFAARLRRRWTLAAILAVHVIFLLSPPLALTDVFNYINYGRMEIVHGVLPVRHDPGARAPRGSGVRAGELAPPDEPLRHLALHPLHLHARSARRRRLLLGLQGHADAGQPGHPRARLALRRAAPPRPAEGGDPRRPQPPGPRLGPRRRAQRLPHGRVHDARRLSPAQLAPPAVLERAAGRRRLDRRPAADPAARASGPCPPGRPVAALRAAAGRAASGLVAAVRPAPAWVGAPADGRAGISRSPPRRFRPAGRSHPPRPESRPGRHGGWRRRRPARRRSSSWPASRW